VTVVNTALPTITGSAQQGQRLTASVGSWTFDLDYLSYAYQWERCDAAGANCVDIANATSSTYVLTSSDVGHEIRVRVTADEHSNAPPPPPPSGNAIYTADFETGDFSQIVSQQESSSGRISLVTGISWGDNYTAKTLIGPTDQGVAGAGSSYRTEMLVKNIAQAYGFSSLQGRETTITWDMLIDPAFDLSSDPNSWLLFVQFWTPGLETGSPCLAINVAQGQMYVTLRGGQVSNSHTRVVPLGAVPLDTLLRWKVHHIWSTTTGGHVEVWRNDVKIVDDTQPNLASGYEAAVELKMGTYRSGVDPPVGDSYVLFDNINFWPSDPAGPTPQDFSGDWHAANSTGLLTQPQAADYTFVLDGTPDSRMQLVTTPKRRSAANYSVKVTVPANAPRAENSATHYLYTPGMEFWAAWSIYLDSTWTPPLSFALFHQFFGETGGQSTGSPPIALEITTGSNFELRVRGGSKASAGASAPKDVGHTIAAVSKSVWHDFLMHVILAKDSSGLVEVYHRIQGGSFPGTPNATDTGMNVLTVAGIDQNVYPESGYYRAADPSQVILYTAGMWIRSTRVAAEAFFS